MLINNKIVNGNQFAYDGCHKIYVIEDEQDLNEAIEADYDIYDISEIEDKYNNSCELRFIYNWKLSNLYVKQFEQAIFDKSDELDQESEIVL